jgi:hypothetical protein
MHGGHRATYPRPARAVQLRMEAAERLRRLDEGAKARRRRLTSSIAERYQFVRRPLPIKATGKADADSKAHVTTVTGGRGTGGAAQRFAAQPSRARL